jgi:hypothetical protein
MGSPAKGWEQLESYPSLTHIAAEPGMPDPAQITQVWSELQAFAEVHATQSPRSRSHHGAWEWDAQSSSPAHANPQEAPEQISPLLQDWSQDPQWAGSELRSRQVEPPHVAQHVPSTQEPPSHAFAHVPQCAGSLSTFTSQPLDAS